MPLTSVPTSIEEGHKGAVEMCKLLEGSATKNVVELVGNVGSSAAKDRGQGFREDGRLRHHDRSVPDR
jgi:ABC-type sugar transport system substrate-binding protein